MRRRWRSDLKGSGRGSRVEIRGSHRRSSRPSRFEEVTQQEDYVFPAGSPSARTPMVYRDKPSFEESFPASTDKSSAFQKIEGLANTIVGSVVKPIEWATEKYEEYVGGPIRRTMFKEDPLVTLDRQHRERQAVLEATGASEGKRRGRRRNTSARAWWQACWLTRCQVLWANGRSPKGRRRSLILGPIRAFGRVLFSRSKSGKDPGPGVAGS